MAMTNPEAKTHLRQMIRARLENISPAVRAVESVDVCARLKTQIQSANTILFFAPLDDELDIWPVLELSVALGTICALPFFDAEKKSYGARVLEKLATDIVTGKIRRARTGGELRGDFVEPIRPRASAGIGV